MIGIGAAFTGDASPRNYSIQNKIDCKVFHVPLYTSLAEVRQKVSYVKKGKGSLLFGGDSME